MPQKPAQNTPENAHESPFQTRTRRRRPAPARPAQAKAPFSWLSLGPLSDQDGPLLVALLLTAGAGLSTGIVIGFVIFGL